MPSEQYIPLVEHNDHEGETWTFWMPLTGNEDAIEALRGHINEVFDYEYEVGTESIPEHDVDVLVKHGGQGYMNNHNKLSGKLVLPGFTGSEDEVFEVWNELLYKGGIESLFKEK